MVFLGFFNLSYAPEKMFCPGLGIQIYATPWSPSHHHIEKGGDPVWDTKKFHNTRVYMRYSWSAVLKDH